MKLFKKEEKMHYWRVTIAFQTKEGHRFGRWFVRSENELFPITEMETDYIARYGFKPTILFWGEISEQDYKKLTQSIKKNDE